MSAAESNSMGEKKRKREENPSPTQVLEFLKICGKLKKTARTGVLPMLLSDIEGIDATRCMKIGLVHDLAEALVGDITPHCGVTKEEKNKMEADAMARIRSTVGDSRVGDEIVALWEEYEAGQTAEAQLMKDLDKFEMIAQAEDYETEQGLDLSQFFEGVKGKIKHPEVAGWEAALRAARDERRAAPPASGSEPEAESRP